MESRESCSSNMVSNVKQKSRIDLTKFTLNSIKIEGKLFIYLIKQANNEKKDESKKEKRKN